MVAGALSPEAGDPFCEPTLFEVEPELRRQLEFASRLREAIGEVIESSSETWVGPPLASFGAVAPR